MEKSFLYKYQPQLLKDFDLEPDFVLLLKTLIHINNLNILFIGETGCGKSTLINAVIREYYGVGVLTSVHQENIMYINNLKEQGIAYYRTEVKTFCQTSTLVSGKKKIIVVDDIDLINEQSQQVFRNYIDKYSHNVHFIGSCISIQKVIDSIQSRMTVIKHTKMPEEKLLNTIDRICKNETIEITPDAKVFLLTISNNSIRILVNYLEKFKLLNRAITLELAEKVCTNISLTEFTQYTNYCKNEKNLRAAVKSIYTLSNRGYSVMDILSNPRRF